MSEMLEKAARAACEAADGVFIPSVLDDFGRAHVQRIAAAVIKAIREPTKEVLSAGDDFILTPNIWEAMIDSILSEAEGR